ncbi:MAG: 2-amino-4-hydroxy-6-hydroxymethyldihydropteridine diphosphokinase [Lachnospiraceae bacterium]|nr:2-amino-4-hydroxy-6-hydroxymethyldihydropteridine diphosphokinase [Lachnospiraceae bacterium]
MQIEDDMDQIEIRDLEIYAYHGVFPEEKEKGQLFYVTAVLHTDLHPAGVTDDLALSTHYGEVALTLKKAMESHSFDLIEAAAEHCVREVLLTYPLIRGVDLKVSKPHAPIPVPFEDVSVTIHRGWQQAFLGLGSNMGDSRQILEGSLRALESDSMIRVLKTSDWIVTKPYGGVEQDDFLNGAAQIETLYSPQELLKKLHSIEADYGRTREIHWGPRTLDMDILLFGDLIMDTRELTIPHRDMCNREFVLRPMAQIAPYQHHPGNGLTMEELFLRKK